jgi:hypothetical protein
VQGAAHFSIPRYPDASSLAHQDAQVRTIYPSELTPKLTLATRKINLAVDPDLRLFTVEKFVALLWDPPAPSLLRQWKNARARGHERRSATVF